MARLDKVAIILIVVISLQFLALEAKQSKRLTANYTKEIDPRTKATIQYMLSGLRGLWHGYNKGFYHNKVTVDSRCFSNKSEAEIFEILHFMRYGEFIDILTIADDFYKFF